MVAVLENLQIVIIGVAEHGWSGIKDDAPLRKASILRSIAIDASVGITYGAIPGYHCDAVCIAALHSRSWDYIWEPTISRIDHQRSSAILPRASLSNQKLFTASTERAFSVFRIRSEVAVSLAAAAATRSSLDCNIPSSSSLLRNSRSPKRSGRSRGVLLEKFQTPRKLGWPYSVSCGLNSCA